MIMLLDSSRLKQERQTRAWSQSQVAEFSGVSLRTIQRLEKDGKSSLESAKALAAVFALPVSDLFLKDDSIENEGENKNPKTESRDIEWMTRSSVSICITLLLLSPLAFLVLPLKPGSVWMLVLNYLLVTAAAGLLIDALRNQGLWRWCLDTVRTNPTWRDELKQKISVKVSSLYRALKKPTLIAGFILFSVSGTLFFTMEDYQRDRFLQVIGLPSTSN